ncbi:hypothetical protein H310_00885 [Aphanomyces invadans]|uniref:Macro domain-containing protein n=1 Tax=Aphanomyces invadans TaxID=157072 RepID=A0A024URJ2_9STRA|nr:hypothetical protein H310_00885 [Aphanomyces invadans]ETW08248.1 hypothetical protein H310_00885 [Aphanomyces invadans]|eukprot:XP_008862053.1 hypothetical protein H310_00885 [Aphanomyces invadans]
MPSNHKDTHGSFATVVTANSLPRWGDIPQRQDNDMPPISSMKVPAVHFRYDTGLNAKIALWNGSIWKLEVDAIVNSTNESLTDDTDVSGEVLKAAGNEIFTEIRSVGTCRTGDAVATRACQLPSKKLIHTVGPRYNEKYRIAAENALHSSYRNCLRVAKEERAATVAFPCIYRKKKNYPRDDAVHVALRTIRRFLEHFGDAFDLIVLCVDDSNDFRLYHECLPLYFPRSVGEEIAATVALDTLSHINLGDEHGEPVIEERKIRISSIPFTQDGSDNDVDNSDSNQRRHDEDGSDVRTMPLTGQGFDRMAPDSMVTKAFCEMSPSPDSERMELLKARRRSSTNSRSNPAKEVVTYQEYVHQARHEDFQDIARLGLIHRAGVDHAGAPVLMVVGKNLPSEAVDLDRVLLYVIHVMDAVVDRKYSVVYAHGGVIDQNQPNSTWLNQLFKTFSAKYRDNLKAFYILEATMWLKMTLWLAKAFVHNAFYAKVAYLDSIKALEQVAPSLLLPQDK